MLRRIHRRFTVAFRSWVWAGGVAVMAGCSTPAEEVLVEQEELAETAPEVPLANPEAVLVPPSGDAWLVPLTMAVPVLELPRKGASRVGYLRAGERVSRSIEPVSFEDCPAGWYSVRPVGFVCAENDATTDLEHPVARAIQVPPNREQPLPYAYGFLRAVAPNYLRIPTKKEQFHREMRLARHLRNHKRLSYKWDALKAGANEVPLSAEGLATGGVPQDYEPPSMNVRFGGDGGEEVPWWLEEGTRQIPNLSTFRTPSYAMMAGRIKRHAGVALIGSFVGDKEAGGRRFAISTDARIIPADKIKADTGSPFHGVSIREVGLPVAFARKAGATWWSVSGGNVKRAEKVGWREFAPLSGKVKKIRGVKMVEAKDGRWLRSKDVKTASKPNSLPWFATGKRRWIRVSILSQTLTLWEGSTPVYATLISSGRDGMGDPKTTLSTPQGTFRIYQKHVTTTMDSDVADSEFELRDVPWVMYFKDGYAIHAAYWHDDFGRPRSHGCINLSPIDARQVFNWSLPDVPQDWHGSYAGEAFGKGTIIHIVP